MTKNAIVEMRAIALRHTKIAILIGRVKQCAQEQHLSAEFLQMDVRDVPFKNAFDVVLNLADGAIGYLESEEKNLKIFDVIAAALKPGGKHFMDVCSAEHAEHYFPRTNWEVGENTLSLAQFDWNANTRRMLFGGCDIPYGQPAAKPEIPAADPIRLYSPAELSAIFKERGLKMQAAFSDYKGTPASYQQLQLLAVSFKD